MLLVWKGQASVGESFARSSDWNLPFYPFYTTAKVELELYNLNDDIGESQNIAAQYPEKVRGLNDAYQSWRNEMAPRITPSS